MRSPYSLLARKNTKGKSVYYVRFWLPDQGKYAVPKSTGQTSKAAAKAWAENYLNRGPVILKERVSFQDYATGFFAVDGEFATGMKLKGKAILEPFLMGHQAHLNNHAIPFFGPKLLRSIDIDAMDHFCSHLMAKGLAGSTVKHVQQSVTIMFGWAVRKGLMQTVPESENVNGPVKARGALRPEEVRALFALPDWPPVYLLINLIAYTTGMRQGEIV
jgi:hypothetical protein